MLEKHPFDIGAYEKRAKEGPCFICELVAEGNPHDVIYEVLTLPMSKDKGVLGSSKELAL